MVLSAHSAHDGCLMKKCPVCHQLLPDDALFCPMDGTSLDTVQPPNDPLLGSVIADRYTLIERIAEGQTGIIYRAEHVTLRQRIAIKLLHLRWCTNEALIEQFHREITTLASLQSDNIIKISDFGKTLEGRFFLAMEYLEGETLDIVLAREGRLLEARALQVLQQIGDALSEAHLLGLIHRDIQPKNIFLAQRRDGKEQAKLMGFGIARLKYAFQPTPLSRYVSPEQLKGNEADPRSDIYNLALVAYEMVTGHFPPIDQGAHHLNNSQIDAQRPVFNPPLPGVAETFSNAIHRALSRRIHDRYPTISHFLQGLTQEMNGGFSYLEALPSSPPSSSSSALVNSNSGGRDVLGASVPEVNHPWLGDNGMSEEASNRSVNTNERWLNASSNLKPEEMDFPMKQPNSRNDRRRKSKTNGQRKHPSIVGQQINERITEAEVDETVPFLADSSKVALRSKERTSRRQDRSGSASIPPSKSSVTGSSGLFSQSGRSSINELPNDYQRPVSATGRWFAEGLLAEEMLAAQGKSGPLPAIYNGLEDEEPVKRKLSPMVIIVAVIIVFSLGLLVLRSMFNGTNAIDNPVKRDVTHHEAASTSSPRVTGIKPETQELPRKEMNQPDFQLPDTMVKHNLPPSNTGRAGISAGVPRAHTGLSTNIRTDAKDAGTPVPDTLPIGKMIEPAVPTIAKPDQGTSDKLKTEPKATIDSESLQPASPPATNVNQAQSFVKGGRFNLQKGNHSTAKDLFNKALELDPQNAGGHAGLGEVAFEMGEYPLAIQHLKSAVHLNPRNARYLVMLGNAYFKQGKMNEAIEQYQKALRLDAHNAEARAGLDAASRRLDSTQP